MNIFKRFKDWLNTPTPPAPTEKEPVGEPQEIWQWQINCVAGRYDHYPEMPQNFGLLIGTSRDAEARLKSAVSLPYHFTIETEFGYGREIKSYLFTDPQYPKRLNYPVQRGAIRCVSENMILKRIVDPSSILHGDPYDNNPFIVEMPDVSFNGVSFHPIKPQAHFTKGERNES